MTTISFTTDVEYAEPRFTDAERTALAGFLAGYNGLTRDAYALDLRQYTSWCQQHGLHLFQARRSDIECFGRDMEALRDLVVPSERGRCAHARCHAFERISVVRRG